MIGAACPRAGQTNLGRIPVLDVGGTHVTAASVDVAGRVVLGDPARVDLDSTAAAEAVLDTLADAARAAGASGEVWGVAMPDPFDYALGIGRFHGVAKFEALDGVDVRAGLLARLPGARQVVFVNDADAFALGEWAVPRSAVSAAPGARRVVGITLGTGVGSGWVADGAVAVPQSPPGGRAHLLRVDGRPLEDLVSRRAIRAAYFAAVGDATAEAERADVRDIAGAARGGDPIAGRVLAEAGRALGRALGGPIVDFEADAVVVGGSIARSWGLFAAGFAAGAGRPLPPVAVSSDTERSALVGAACYASRAAGIS